MIDLDAYFRRIGYSGPRKATLGTLRELHGLHPQAIPFENLDPLLKRPVKLDPASLQAKMVEGGRGGYCFEHNSLFANVLRQLGFKVREGTARVRWNVPDQVKTPRVHCLLFVEAEGADYLADVGFGGNVLTAPLKLDAREAQTTPHEEFRLVNEGDGRVVQEAKINGAWTPLYAYDFSETHPSDYEMGNWLTSTHPNSIFVNGLLGARAEPGKRYALRDNQLSVHTTGGGSEKRTLNARELRDALGDLFKLRLSGLDGLDAALARLAAGTA
ncbi:MAG TPA: arylamine N-acetyltransferase [Pseudolabrys sp.]|nr:arylamine N-acetyltransferase [Pseudolabrys sp.]